MMSKNFSILRLIVLSAVGASLLGLGMMTWGRSPVNAAQPGARVYATSTFVNRKIVTVTPQKKPLARITPSPAATEKDNIAIRKTRNAAIRMTREALKATQNPQPTATFVFRARTPTRLPTFTYTPTRYAGNPQSIELNWTTPPYQIMRDAQGFDWIQVMGFEQIASSGSPSLPHKVYNISLPPNVQWDTVRVDVISSQVVDLPGTYEIAPAPAPMAQGAGLQPISAKPTPPVASPTLTADGKDLAVYAKNAFYPDTYVTLLANSQMRKWHFTRIDYIPFQYNAVTKQVRMVTAVKVRIGYNLGAETNDPIDYDGVMDSEASRLLDNYEQAKQWYPAPLSLPKELTSNYVVITTNAIRSKSSKLNDFIKEKQQHGLTTRIVTETDYGNLSAPPPNRTAQKIRQWLQANYVSRRIQYVLLIGNPDPYNPWQSGDQEGDVPMLNCWPLTDEGNSYLDTPTDYYYADLTGNWDLNGDQDFCDFPQGDMRDGGVDPAVEVYVGRIPVYYNDTAALDSILQKTIDYANAANPLWRKSVLLPMSFSDPTTDGALLAEAMKGNYLNSLGYTSYTLYQQGNWKTEAKSRFLSDEELRPGSTAARWAKNFYGLVAWWGHGSEFESYIGYGGPRDGALFNNTESSLLNDAYPAIVFQNSCSNAAPETPANLSYALLQHGAVGTLGASRVSWYKGGNWQPNRSSADNASLGYYVVADIASGSPLAAALYFQKEQMALSWNGKSWMNLLAFNLYGDAVVRMSP